MVFTSKCELHDIHETGYIFMENRVNILMYSDRDIRGTVENIDVL